LFLTDPVDEMLAQWVWEYKEKKLKSIAKGVADLATIRISLKVKEFSSLMDVLQRSWIPGPAGPAVRR
jgi:hypothetical protein